MVDSGMITDRIFNNRLVFGVVVVIAIWLIGSLFYYKVEHFTILDSFYFAATTLTTVGFGDLHPVTPLGKIFTVAYVFTGLGVVLYVLSLVGRHYLDSEFEAQKKRFGKLKEIREGRKQ